VNSTHGLGIGLSAGRSVQASSFILPPLKRKRRARGAPLVAVVHIGNADQIQ
jgi:hypothetical protein